MAERTSRKSVTFEEPFFVEGLGRDQSAGTYEVEIVEESIDALSFLAYRVVSASIVRFRFPAVGRIPISSHASNRRLSGRRSSTRPQ